MSENRPIAFAFHLAFTTMAGRILRQKVERSARVIGKFCVNSAHLFWPFFQR